jgi:hypothetical protein
VLLTASRVGRNALGICESAVAGSYRRGDALTSRAGGQAPCTLGTRSRTASRRHQGVASAGIISPDSHASSTGHCRLPCQGSGSEPGPWVFATHVDAADCWCRWGMPRRDHNTNTNTRAAHMASPFPETPAPRRAGHASNGSAMTLSLSPSTSSSSGSSAALSYTTSGMSRPARASPPTRSRSTDSRFTDTADGSNSTESSGTATSRPSRTARGRGRARTRTMQARCRLSPKSSARSASPRSAAFASLSRMRLTRESVRAMATHVQVGIVPLGWSRARRWKFERQMRRHAWRVVNKPKGRFARERHLAQAVPAQAQCQRT